MQIGPNKKSNQMGGGGGGDDLIAVTSHVNNHMICSLCVLNFDFV